jgi:hypothetical protein
MSVRLTTFKTGIACTLIALAASSAHAELQVWRFKGQVDQHSIGETALPAFVNIGTQVTIDYLIDMSVPVVPDTIVNNFVKRIRINGRNVEATGYLIAWPGSLNAINTSITNARADGLNFISFNRSSPPVVNSAKEALEDYKLAVATTPMQNRLDFGGSSAYVGATSFQQVQLPSVCKSPFFVKLDPRCAILVPAN